MADHGFSARATTSDEAPILTEELMLKAFEGIKRRSDEYLRAPKGPCGCTACVVHPKTRDRLQREGGYARCANCFGGFYIDPPDAR